MPNCVVALSKENIRLGDLPWEIAVLKACDLQSGPLQGLHRNYTGTFIKGCIDIILAPFIRESWPEAKRSAHAGPLLPHCGDS